MARGRGRRGGSGRAGGLGEAWRAVCGGAPPVLAALAAGAATSMLTALATIAAMAVVPVGVAAQAADAVPGGPAQSADTVPVWSVGSADTVRTWSAEFVVEVVADGLAAPVALAFLPDGRGLLAERGAGRVSLLDPETGARTPVEGLPPVRTEGDGGLLDVALDPAWFDEPGGGGADGSDGEGWIYIAYSETAPGGSATVLDRARLADGRWSDRERLFTSDAFEEDVHFGGRIAFADGYVFLTIGDRGARDLAQSPGTHNGTVVRLHLDGTVPDDNPFVGVGVGVGEDGARPEVWSYGHRNAQGMAVHPATGSLWLDEHGPRGGDEVNVVRPGANYGWPRVTYGEEYEGGPVGDGRVTRPGLTQPIWMWRPSIAPSGLVFYRGGAFPTWRSSALVGALGLEHLVRLTLDGDRILHEERLLEDRGWRVRLVAEDADGHVWLGTDSGLLVRLRPVAEG